MYVTHLEKKAYGQDTRKANVHFQMPKILKVLKGALGNQVQEPNPCLSLNSAYQMSEVLPVYDIEKIDEKLETVAKYFKREKAFSSLC